MLCGRWNALPTRRLPQRWSSLVALLASLTWSAAALASASHPLDPLTAEEIKQAVTVIAFEGRVDRTTRAAIITLKEPPKQDVLQWNPGESISRKAFAVLRIKGETIEAVVDLDRNTLESWTVIPGAQPAIQSTEWAEADRILKSDEGWKAAMRQRGYGSFEDIFCESLSAGYFSVRREEGRRLLKMPCYDISQAENNVYARPIEGLIATVDPDRREVVSLLDEGTVPTPPPLRPLKAKVAGDKSASAQTASGSGDKAHSFAIDGHLVSWQNWSFHLGFDARFGPVLSLVNFRDARQPRSILYQAHVSEVFVPYMEPSQSWSFRTYMDAGEYGMGVLSSTLVPGIDCPPSAAFLDATLASAAGKAYQRPAVMCVFERATGNPLWRHYEALNGSYEGRSATELVVRSIPSIAHYDYVIDWVFAPSGAIEARIGATGIDAVKGVAIKNLQDPGSGDATSYGSLVSPGLVAIHHDHFFSLRLDFDIDGTGNRFVRERMSQVMLPKGSPRRSLWQLGEDPMTVEGAVSAMDGPQVWRIENREKMGSMGQHPSYQIQGVGPTSMLSADDWPQRRAAFSASNLWLTVHHDGERYAAGAYPNQSPGGDGLLRYVDGEAVTGGDLVAWYTVGFRHVTRPEDWPILSTVWQRVMLRPYGFFDHNPSLNFAH